MEFMRSPCLQHLRFVLTVRRSWYDAKTHQHEIGYKVSLYICVKSKGTLFSHLIHVKMRHGYNWYNLYADKTGMSLWKLIWCALPI